MPTDDIFHSKKSEWAKGVKAIETALESTQSNRLGSDVREQEIMQRTARGIAHMKKSMEIYSNLAALSASVHVCRRTDEVFDTGTGIKSVFTFLAGATMYYMLKHEWGIPFFSTGGLNALTGKKTGPAELRVYVEKGWIEIIDNPRDIKKKVGRAIGDNTRTNLYAKSLLRGTFYTLTPDGMNAVKDMLGFQIEFMDMAAYIGGLAAKE